MELRLFRLHQIIEKRAHSMALYKKTLLKRGCSERVNILDHLKILHFPYVICLCFWL